MGERRRADDDEERGRGEHLMRLRAAHGAEQARHDQPAAEEDRGDDAEPARHLGPGHRVRDVPRREERRQRDERDEGDVLEEEEADDDEGGGPPRDPSE